MIGPRDVSARDLPDPDGTHFGIPTFRWGLAPDGLATLRQLHKDGLSPSHRADIVAQILRPRGGDRGPLAGYLYRREDAKPKRQATPAQREVLDRGRRTQQEQACLRHGIDLVEEVDGSEAGWWTESEDDDEEVVELEEW